MEGEKNKGERREEETKRDAKCNSDTHLYLCNDSL